MSGAQIAQEVAAALREVARDVGEGIYLAKLIQVASAPSTPWDSAGETTVETELDAMVSDYAQSLIDGTLIRQGDKRVMVEATGPEPTQADKLEIDGVIYQIVNVKPLKPSGVALYYTLQCRR